MWEGAGLTYIPFCPEVGLGCCSHESCQVPEGELLYLRRTIWSKGAMEGHAQIHRTGWNLPYQFYIRHE